MNSLHVEVSATPKISLIVAVYNAEKYFDAFMHSVLAQTFKDFELLLINDGSTDSSGAMCDDYAAHDKRIKVIHKPNGGVASARQVGIDNARGEYTIHADPDDTVAPTFLEELYTEAKKEDADMVICDWYKVKERRSKYASNKISSLSPTRILDGLLHGTIQGYLWNKLIRRSLYAKYNISFVEGLNFCEDLLVCVKMTLHDIKIAYIKRGLYYYNLFVNPNSISRYFTPRMFEMRMLLHKHLLDIIPEGTHISGLNHLTTVAAYQALKHGMFSAQEFEETYRQYTHCFWASNYSLKRRLALILAARGHQTFARFFIKKK